MARREPVPAPTRARHPVTPLRRALAVARLALIVVGLGAATIALDLNLRTLLENGPALRRATPPLEGLPFLGMTVDWDEVPAVQRREDAARLAAGGVGWVRLRMDWAQIEAEPGVYAWEASDAHLADIDAAGLVPVLVLDGSPAWARAPRDRTPLDNQLAPPENFATFATFAAAVAQRYGPRVRYYQIWDEPNIAPHWGDRHIEPVHYAQMLRVAAGTVRVADPDARIISGALAPTTDRGHTAMDEVRFLQRMLAAGARADMDAVAVQPFGFGATAEDNRRRVDVLNAQRMALIRRTLAAAGAQDVPIIAARFGWNDRPHSPWRTVLDPARAEFAQTTLTLARQHWPWLAAAGWAVDRPAAPPDDPLWGFATNDALTAALNAGAAATPVTPAQGANQVASVTIVLVIAAMFLAGWRARQAAEVAGVHTGLLRLRGAVVAQIGLWLLLMALYYVTTWPPVLIGLLALAAVLIWIEPRSALLLALFLLPLHIYHKEFHFAVGTITLPPAQAVLLAALPILVQAMLQRARHRQPRRFRNGVDGPALGWLVLGALAVNVWHWPGYAQGVLDLVVAPLLLYALMRVFAQDARTLVACALALFAGGVAAALIGLAGWSGGMGTVADGLRRLVGPHFSPNHTALYLERTLFLGMGLCLGAWQFFAWSPSMRQAMPLRTRLTTGVILGSVATGVAIVAAALLLTASRGALMLAVPAGLLTLAWLATAQSRPRRDRSLTYALGKHQPAERTGDGDARRAWHARPARAMGSLVPVLVLVVVVLMLVATVPAPPILLRLANTATVAERVAIWRATVDLWRAVPVFGTGAGGFYWMFPAHIPVQAAVDPNLRHPHNVWLEMLAGWGLVGGIWLAWMLVQWGRVGRGLRRAHRENAGILWPAMGLLAGLVAGLAHGQVDAFLSLPDLAAWNWAAPALLAQWMTHAKRPSDGRHRADGP